MADVFDQAQEREQLDRDRAIEASRSGPRLDPAGLCHWCGELTDKLFCDADCRTDWQRAQDAKKRQRGMA